MRYFKSLLIGRLFGNYRIVCYSQTSDSDNPRIVLHRFDLYAGNLRIVPVSINLL